MINRSLVPSGFFALVAVLAVLAQFVTIAPSRAGSGGRLPTINPLNTAKPHTPHPSPIPSGPTSIVYKPLKVSGHLDRTVVVAAFEKCPTVRFTLQFTPTNAYAVSHAMSPQLQIFMSGKGRIAGDGANETIPESLIMDYSNGRPTISVKSTDFFQFVTQVPHSAGCEPGRQYTGRRIMRLMSVKTLKDDDKLGNFKTTCKKNPSTGKIECKVPSTSSATLAGTGTALGHGPEIDDTVTWRFKVTGSKLSCKQQQPDGTLKDCK